MNVKMIYVSARIGRRARFERLEKGAHLVGEGMRLSK